ncbi:MAG: hypothetical protein U1G07_19460 [Verrucomicrobiota bacterium]
MTSVRLICPALLLCLASASVGGEPARVKLIRVPDGGIQPQVLRDQGGTLHLLYYKGAAEGGDLFYVRREAGSEALAKPVPVNTSAAAHRAIAMGSIRGAQMALGREGRVHVAWNGRPPANGNWKDAPMLYTRLNDARTAFEPARNVITAARGLDGGGSIAADEEGNVYVMWHAPRAGRTEDEEGRAVFVARSSDDGTTFAPERAAAGTSSGVCACCGMKVFADRHGHVLALYRAASAMTNRAETLLLSRNHGDSFEVIYSHNWQIASCPMSSAFLSEAKGGVLAAAETEGHVFYVRLDPSSGKVSPPVSPGTQGKYPTAIANQDGQVLLVWTEGTSWGKGGSAAWQVYDVNGTPTSPRGKADGVPAWSFAVGAVASDGSFEVYY